MEPINQTETQLKELKMHGIIETLAVRAKQAFDEELSYTGFLGLLLQDELDHRKNLKIKTLLKQASFAKQATLESFDYSFPRNVSKNQISELATMKFIQEGLNLVFIGATGVGKSHLACALGHHACRRGYLK